MGIEPTRETANIIHFDVQKGYYRALLNILDDYKAEEEKSKELQRASLNILEDFNNDRIEFHLIQQATLNLLDDMYEKRITLEETQHAVMNILEDIEEERKRTEESKKLLELANKELEAFSYSVSHDLQAPLRAINGFAQAVLEDYAPKIDPEGQHYLKLLQENSHFMGQLIRDLLSFSRLGRQQIGITKINMEQLAKTVFEEAKAEIPDRIIHFKLNCLPEASGDAAMIRQIFVNLFSNALKFTRLRKETFIEVGYCLEQNEGCYYVKDNGVGFDMRYIDKLFGVFQRLHTTEEFEGTGIGLALIKRIVARHGGKVFAKGAINEGACFYFSLPEGK